MANKVFQVLTEFKFEGASAVASASVIEDSVGRISIAADNALSSLVSMGKSFLANFGLAGGIAGVMGAAINSAEKFQRSALQISNIVGSNLDSLSGDVTTFNDRLKFSEQTLMRISKVASEFGLSEDVLANTTKNLAAMLIPKGLAGNNLSNAIDLSRSFEKSAPTLGVDTQLAQGELIRMIEGASSMNDTLFRRLMAETRAFADLRGGSGKKSGAQAFNALPMEERFRRIQKGMQQFSSDGDVLSGMLGLLSNKFQLLKDRLMGINGILKPLGEAVLPALRAAFDALLKWLDTKGRVVVETLAAGLNAIAANPEGMLATLMQIRDLRDDLSSAGKLAGLIGLATMIGPVVRFLSKVPMVGAAITAIGGFFSMLGSALASMFAALGGWGTVMLVVGFGVKALAWAFSTLLMPLAAIVAGFQLLSRAIAYAKIADAKALMENMDRLTVGMARLGKALFSIVKPFVLLFDMFAKLISPLFMWSIYLNPVIAIINAITTAFEFMGLMMQIVAEGLWAFVFSLIQIAQNIGASAKSLLSGNFKGIWDAWTKPQNSVAGAAVAGQKDMQDMLGNNTASPDNVERQVQNNVTNINAVNIRQDFKENMEPDRIAHSLVKTLAAIGKNPTQSQNRSMQGALVR